MGFFGPKIRLALGQLKALFKFYFTFSLAQFQLKARQNGLS